MPSHALAHDDQGRIDLRSLDWDAFRALVVDEWGDSATRARRVFRHIWTQPFTSFEVIPNLALATRRMLEQRAYVPTLQTEQIIESEDGTTKFLWRCEDGAVIESVLIPDNDRLTLCMSSQVGCAMACTFCLTGDMGLKRQLKASEIAMQPLLVGLSLPPEKRIANLVLMGMGEPLHNLDNLVPALTLCMDDHGLNFGHRKITVSTVGLVPKMAELAAALPVNLAVSINATTEEQRRQIMPITRKHSLAELLDACRAFPLPSGKSILFEYVMLAGFNDTDEDAVRLADLLEGIPSKINLIPYNENPDRDLRRPGPERVTAFQALLMQRGYFTKVRITRGIDVSAACGQLGKARQRNAPLSATA